MNTPIVARFNTLIRPYLVFRVGMAMAVTIIGIPLALIWFLGVGQWWARHYFEKLYCEINERSLRFRKGILFQVEKTIPLENIQDVTFVEGPVLKRFHLSILKFETAGQSAGQAHDMHLIGIIDAHEFRDQILAARDRLKREFVVGRKLSGESTPDNSALVTIDKKLDVIISLLREIAGHR